MKRIIIIVLLVLFLCVITASAFVIYVSRDVFDDILVMRGCEYNLEGKSRLAKIHFFIAKLLGQSGHEIQTVLGTSYYNLGQYEKAAKEFEKAFDDVAKEGHDYGVGSLLAVSYAHLGKKKQALKMCNYIIDRWKEEDAFNRYNVACAYSVLGDKENALRYLEEAVKRESSYSKMAIQDKDFVKLKDDLRFRKIIDKYYIEGDGEDVPSISLNSSMKKSS